MKKEDLQKIGKRIADRRKQLGKTQENLAEKMEVSVQMVSNLERGEKAIRIDNLVKLCQALDVSSDYILTGRVVPEQVDPLQTKIALLSAEDKAILQSLIDRLIKADGNARG